MINWWINFKYNCKYYCVIFVCMTSFCYSQDMRTVYIHPGQWGDVFAIDNPIFNRDNCLEPICQLRDKALEKGISIRQISSFESLPDFEYLIVFEVPTNQLAQLEKYPKEKLILFLWEPPSVVSDNYEAHHHRNFARVYTWRDDLVDNQKYFKLYYPVAHPVIDQQIDFKQKKLATLIGCNKNSIHPQQLYGERQQVIQFFENGPIDDFDLYGKWWPAYKAYKGPIDKKVDVLKNYRFCFAYENITQMPGYVTEKIFDCFQACCVPIYWGASNICTYVPKNCFIDRRDFLSNQELYDFLKQMNEEDYQKYLTNAKEFLLSEQAKLYSIDHFVATVMEFIDTKREGIQERSENAI